MSDYSELNRLAKAATPGRIHDRLDICGGGLKYACVGDDGSLVLKVDHKNDEWGFVGDNRAADEEFFLACTPALVLGLIAENESLRKDADRFRFIEQDASSGMSKIYGDDWVSVIDAAMTKGAKP